MTEKEKQQVLQRLHYSKIVYKHQLHCSAHPLSEPYGPGCSCEHIAVVEYKRPLCQSQSK